MRLLLFLGSVFVCLLVSMEVSRYYQRVQIQFMTKLGMKGSAVHRFLQCAHRQQALSQGSVYCWMRHFRNGRDNCSDTPRSGCPTKLTPEKEGQTNTPAAEWGQDFIDPETVNVDPSWFWHRPKGPEESSCTQEATSALGTS